MASPQPGLAAQHQVTLLDHAHLRTGRGFVVWIVGFLPSETPPLPSSAELGSP